jgi:hypothetical protein
MRILGILLLIFALTVLSCHSDSKQKTTQKKNLTTEKKKDPVDLGDPSEPLEIRALKGAEQVKKDADKKREEEKRILEQRDQ